MAGAATRKISAVLALAIVGAAVWFARPTDVAPPRVEPTSAPPAASTKRVRHDESPSSRDTATDHVIAGRVTGLVDGVTARVEARRTGDCPAPRHVESIDDQFAAPPEAAPAAATATTSADGAFALTVSTSGAYLVTATLADGREASVDADVPDVLPRVDIEIAAPRAGANVVKGRVVRADGTPARGWVEMVPAGDSPSDWRPRWTPIDDGGRFGFRGVEIPRCRIDVVLPGESCGTSGEFDLPHGDDVTVTIGAAGVRRGRVIAESDGAPIAGAVVFARSDGWTFRVVSAADGAFALPAAAGLIVEARAPRFVVARADAGADVMDARLPRIAGDEIVLRMKRAATVVGRVLRSSDGTPVAGAVVRAAATGDWYFSSSSRSSDATTSDAAGAFRIDGVQPGKCDLFVLGGGWASVGLTTWSRDVDFNERADPYAIDVAAGGTESVDLRVEPMGRVEGRVFAPAGEPIAAAKVELSCRSDEKNGPQWNLDAATWTGTDGSFAFADLPAARGGYGLASTVPGLPPADERFGATAGATTKTDLRFAAPQRVDALVVADETGAPIPDAKVALYAMSDGGWSGPEGGEGRAGADGRCVIADAPDIRVGVIVRAAGFLPSGGDPIPATQDAADPRHWRVEVRLKPAFVVSGRVLNADGSPAPRLSLQLFKPHEGEEEAISASGSTAETDDDGKFRFDEVPAGTWWLCQWFDEKIAEVVAGGPDVVVHLPPEKTDAPEEGGVAVHIVGPDGERVSVTVCDRCRQRSGRGWWEHGELSLRSDDGGDGCYLAIYDARDAAGEPLPFGDVIVPLPAKLPPRLEIRLPKERVASGRVIGVDGRGVANARLHVRFADRVVEDETPRDASTDADGGFEIHRLGEGAYCLTIDLSKDQAPPLPLTIRGGQRDVVVDLAAGSSVVALLDYDGKPVRGAVVEVRATKVEQKPRRRDAEPDDPPEFEDAPRVLVHLVAGADGKTRVNGIVPGTEVALFVAGPANRDDLAPWSESPWTPHDVEVRLDRKK